MELYWATALIITNLVWAVLAFFLIKNEDKEKRDLRDRFMSRDFREYSYYTEELPEFQKERKKEREKRETPHQRREGNERNR